jgi:dipeptidase
MKTLKSLFSIVIVFMLTALFSSNAYAKDQSLKPETGILPHDEKECFMVMVGKKASADGSVLIAHNNDLRGNNAARIEKFPRQKHEAGEVIRFSSGLEIPQVEETYEWMVLQIYKGFAEGDAIGINEYQVSIGGGVALGRDITNEAKTADPLVKEGLTGGVRYIALQRSKTARECVQLIGDLYTQYGITYPSGVSVADPNEIWYIEPGGGHTWAAVRIPDDCYWAQANGLRIGEIDLSDTENVITSPDLLEHAKKNGLWKPEEGPFNFARAFGQRRIKESDLEYYDSRRVWDALRILSPSQKFDPYQHEYPMFVKPDKKITVPQLISDVLRSHYDGTIFDIYPEAGPSSRERAIAVQNCVHTDVVQLRNWMPPDVAAVLWAGMSAPATTVFVPYYYGITDIPKPYKVGGPEYDPRSAFWVFRSLSSLVSPHYKNLIVDVLPVWENFEAIEYALQPIIEKTALDLYKNDKTLAKQFLTAYSNGLSLKTLNMAEGMVDNLRSKIAEQSYLW